MRLKIGLFNPPPEIPGLWFDKLTIPRTIPSEVEGKTGDERGFGQRGREPQAFSGRGGSTLGLKATLLLVAIFVYGLGAATLELFAQDKIVAVVNNDIITQKDLNDFTNFMRVQLSSQYQDQRLQEKIDSMKSDLLDRLIEDRLILQQAKKNNIKVDDLRVKAKIDEIRRRYSSDAEFKSSLTQQGLVIADLETRIREQLLMYSVIEAKIKNRVVINPLEVTEFYQKNAGDFRLPHQYVFELVASEDEQTIKEIYDSIGNGRAFREAADKYSLPVSEINTDRDGQLRKDIQDAVSGLKADEVSGPIKIDAKYYLFNMRRIIPPKQQALLEVQDSIYAFLFDRKMQEEMGKWLDELKKHSYIKISNS